MKLDEFVRQSLVDITKGVTDAQMAAEVTIAPARIEGQRLFEPKFVTFELTISESAEAGGGIRVLSFGEAKGGMRSEFANKISFSVPVHFNSENVFKKQTHVQAEGDQ